MPRLDLSRPRAFGELLRTTFGIWFRHFPVFFVLALFPVAPYVVLLEDRSAAAELTSAVLVAFVVPSIVTAFHVVAVQDLAAGRAPTVWRSMKAAAPALFSVVIVEVLYTVWIFLGLFIFLVGFLYFAVRYYFAAQAVIVDGKRGMNALRRSGELVRGRWWRTFGVVLFIYLVGRVFIVPLRFIDTGSAYAYVAAGTAAIALCLSYTALAGTLLFFDLNARRESALGSVHSLDRPERSIGPGEAG